MIARVAAATRVSELLRESPVVAILGARQVGKTTLAHEVAEADSQVQVHRFDLEDPDDLARLQEPALALRPLRGLVVLDEIQRRPDLFPLLRVLADRPGEPARFLLLGSAAPDLLRQSSESLAGRIQFHHLAGFNLAEVGADQRDLLWERGGFPRSFLARSETASATWRRGFVRTFLERDLPQLGVRVPASALGRFWEMLAHYHGQVWNAAELARSLAVSESTARRYLDLLTSTFVVTQLKPWHENVGKRQVKAPKVYFTDSGLLHTLLRIGSREQLLRHPRLGASWEGFALAQVVACLAAEPEDCFFWRAHTGAELDLLVMRGSERWGFEVKRTSAPKLTPAMRSAMETLRLNRLFVVHAGAHGFPLAAGVTAVPLADIDGVLTAGGEPGG